MLLKYLSYIFLFFSVISLWMPSTTKFKPWQIMVILTLILSVSANISNYVAITSIALFYFLVKLQQDSPKKIWISILVLILAVMLEFHLIPGFHNLLIFAKVQFSKDAIPFTGYLNLDKTLVGVIILGLTLKLAQTWDEWCNIFKQAFYTLPLIVVVILTLSYSFGYVKFEPKVVANLWIWIIGNLFFTCLAEEALFRGFIQESISKLNFRYADIAALFISAILFGLAHFAGGIKYIILASVAGLFYGWVYKKTRKIEASILTHFLLNLVHILLFTYPALA